MALPVPSEKIPRAAAAGAGDSGRWLDAKDRRIVMWAFAGAVVAAVAFGAMMFALSHANLSTLDPDAQTLVIPPDYPRRLAEFSLVDQQGRRVTRADLSGKIVVVDFIFTSCSLTCPYVNAQMKAVQNATAGRADVKLLSITLDPVDDTAPVLARYAPTFNADPSRWLFLTGNAAVVRELVVTSFLPPDTSGKFSYMPGNFAHVQRIVLVDRHGNIVSYFDGLNQDAGGAILQAIRQLDRAP